MGGRAVDAPAPVRLLPPKLLAAWAAMLAGFITWQVPWARLPREAQEGSEDGMLRFGLTEVMGAGACQERTP